MRKMFPGYYKFDDEFFSRIWKEGIFVFDTNVLLDIYRIADPKPLERFFTILEKLKDRIWLPYQVGLEFHRNRLEVVSKQIGIYDEIKNVINKNVKDIENLSSTHPSKRIPFDQLTKIFKAAGSAASELLDEVRKDGPVWTHDNDLLYEKIASIFEDKIGDPYPMLILQEKKEQVSTRYSNQIPPGYKDVGKKADPTGDGLIWFQLLDKAKLDKKPIIFITDDNKEDWWVSDKNTGNKKSPRPELLLEMRNEAGVDFYMYNVFSFIKYAQEKFNLTPQPELAQELEQIAQENEAKQEQEEQIRIDISNIYNSMQTLGRINSPARYSSMVDAMVKLGENQRAFLDNINYTPLLEVVEEIIKRNERTAQQLRDIARSNEARINSFYSAMGPAVLSFGTQIIQKKTELEELDSSEQDAELQEPVKAANAPKILDSDQQVDDALDNRQD